ncbi:MAG: MFS transporter, partial [Pseudomonadota bacterium]
MAFSNLLAQSAEQIALAAAPLVAVLVLGASVAEVGWLQVALTLPFLFFAIPAGLLADRMSKQRLMAYAEGLRAASLVTIMVLLFLEQLTLPLLAIVGLAGVCGTVVFTVAAPALVPSIVPSCLFGKANSRLELAATLAFMAGPAIGGALVGWTGAAAAFGLACALSIYATALLHRVEEPVRPPVVYKNPFVEIREGASFVFGHQHLAPIFATQFVFNAAFFVLMAVFVPYAVRNLNMSASEVGFVMSTLGAGMFLGAFGAPRVLHLLPF